MGGWSLPPFCDCIPTKSCGKAAVGQGPGYCRAVTEAGLALLQGALPLSPDSALNLMNHDVGGVKAMLAFQFLV